MKNRWFLGLVIVPVVVFFLSAPVFSLAPPRIHESVPEDGGILTGPVIEMHGYSLEYAPKGEPVATDKTTGRKVKADAKTKCEWYGEGDRPGDQQQYCVVTITLQKVCAGHTYEVTYLNKTISVKADKSLPKCGP